MEENAEARSLSARNDNYELEKFKRRLIRAVARMLLHEKRNEDEVWAGLKKQTGCDCKELWSRMHALTMKKLDRLLSVQDEVEQLPKAARMSITDWLLFDTVIVHEEFDVIGITETTKEDKKILEELFELVEKFQIEFLAGDNLAQAWMEATLFYNKDHRQCSPMLLQRRWYQLKLATRARFYKFWSMYKGVEKRLPLGEPFKPTPLQTSIAKRYKPLVVKPFMMWEDLLKNNLIILPEHFERLAAEKQQKKDVEEAVPDIVCLEPEVETIDILEDNSDGELEYRKEEENNVSMVKIKQEPIDNEEMETEEAVPYENRQERISNFAEAAMEATAIELDEIELTNDIDHFLDDKSTGKEEDAVLVDVDKTKMAATETVPPSNIENTSTEVITTEPANIQDDDVIPVSDEIIPHTIDDDVIPVITDDNIVPVTTAQAIPVPTDDDVIPIPTEDDNAETAAQNLVQTDVIHIEAENQGDIETPEIVLPQITSVFGGVDVSSDTLSKIGLLTAEITKNIPNFNIGTADVEMSVVPESNDSVEAVHEKVDIKIEPDVSNVWYNELPTEIEFADDGIQLMEEEEFDDEFPKPIATVKIEKDVDTITKTPEPTVEENKETEEPKVDEKLLLIPTVATVKLDDMGILPIHLLKHINNKALIDVISVKSKVLPKVAIKPEPVSVPDPKPEPDSEPDIEPPVVSDMSDEEIIQEPKRVKLTSALLQKPRNRSYNLVQLCKNPDFNTRLKRLNAGFFRSRRNVLLLKACEPLTIDISKAFESKLVNGTMYLKASDEQDLKQKVDLTENSQNVSVVPSAMVVQSLIDNTQGEISAVMYSRNIPKSVPPPTHRNKVINLPDITEIRRINQNLLTAEVMPLQMKNNYPEVPGSIVSSERNSQNDVYSVSGKAGPACRTRQRPEVVDITDKNVNPAQPKSHEPPVLPKTKVPPWRIKYKPAVPWYSSDNSVYAHDTLLALDTLNKMLFLLSNGDIGVGTLPKKKTPRFLNKKAGKRKKDDDDDVQLVSETVLNKKEAKRCRQPKTVTPRPVYCCWCREKICQSIFYRKRLSKHRCPFPLCLCCCKDALLNYYNKQREKNARVTLKDVPQPLGCISSALGLEYVGVETHRLLRQVPQNIMRPKKTPPHKISDTEDVAEIIPIDDDQPTTSNHTGNETTDNTARISVDTNPNETVCDDSESDNVNKEAVDDDDDSVNDNNDSFNVDNKLGSVEDEPTNESERDKNDCDGSSDIAMGTKVSVSTAEGDVIALTTSTITTATNTEPIQSKKPRIRVKCKQKLVDVNLQQKNISYAKNGPPQPLPQKMATSIQHIRVTSEACKKSFLIIDPSKMVDTTSQERHNSFSEDNINKIKSYSRNISLTRTSEKTLDSPVFLGKDKILLTTAKIPPNFKAFEEFQRSIKHTLALPQSLQLVLSPSGRVEYSIHGPISDVFMAKLPELIEAIQQHIDQSVPCVTRPVIACTLRNNSQDDVINLSDDETPAVTQNSEITDKAPENNQNEITQMTDIPVVEKEDSTTTKVEDISQIASTEEITVEQSESSTINDNEKESQKNIEILESNDKIAPHVKLSANVEEIIPSSDTTEVATQHSETTITNVEVGNENTNTNEVTTGHPEATINTNAEAIDNDMTQQTNTESIENVSTESKASKPKNILSDLMALSGIEEMDIAPVPKETLSTTDTQEISPDPLVAQSEPSLLQPVLDPPMELAHTSQVPDFIEQPVTVTGPEATALFPITSLCELKYACAQKGLFFKLDFITGLLVPINVCMKKLARLQPSNQSQSKSRVPRCMTYISKKSDKGRPSTIISSEPKPVIDLTDDDICETVQPQTSLKELTNPQQEIPNVQVLSTRSLLIDQNNMSGGGTTHYNIVVNNNDTSTSYVLDQKNNLKPVKLFRKIKHPNISNISNVQGVIDGSSDASQMNINLGPFKMLSQKKTPTILKMKKRQHLKDTNTEASDSAKNVKPVALFKHKTAQSNTLRLKLKAIQKRIRDAMSVQDMIRQRLKRKQEIIPKTNKLMSVSSDSDSDSDSDEEPLAKIATKMRELEKEVLQTSDGYTIVKHLGENSKHVENVPESNTADDTDVDMPVEALEEDSEEIEDQVNDEPSMTQDINMSIECLEEELLQDDEAADDCILGV